MVGVGDVQKIWPIKLFALGKPKALCLSGHWQNSFWPHPSLPPMFLSIPEPLNCFISCFVKWPPKPIPPVKRVPLREGSGYQIRWFFGKIPNGLWPPPLIFGKLYCKFFIMNMVAFMQGGIGHIVSVNINTIVEKTYPEPWSYSSFYQFHAQKALFKVPKICNINFWIENPPPFGTFSKIHPIW